MPHLGPQRTENTRPITGTNHSSDRTRISKQPAAPPTPRGGAARSPPPHSPPAASAAGKDWPWAGSIATPWYMTIVGTKRGTIPWHQSVGVKMKAKFTLYPFVGSNSIFTFYLSCKHSFWDWSHLAKQLQEWLIIIQASKRINKHRNGNFCVVMVLCIAWIMGERDE